MNRPAASSRIRFQMSWKIVFCALFAVAFALYLRSLQVPFHFDDTHAIADNVAVHSLSNLFRFWTDTTTSSAYPENRNFRPLVFTVYAFCWQLGGGAVWAFHLLKILWHSITALMIFLIWRRLFALPGWLPLSSVSVILPGAGERKLDSEALALLLALLFTVHPACSEVATYICANTTLQSAMFYLISFWLFLIAWTEKRPNPGSFLSWRLASVGVYCLSVFSKEEGITLPAMIFATVFLLSEGPIARRVRSAIQASWPYWIAFAGLVLLVRHMVPAIQAKSRGGVPPLDYFMTEWRAWLWYMRLWFWPWDLNADNTGFGFSHSFFETRVVQALIGNMLILGFTFWSRRRFPALLFGVLWFYITISPASSLIPLAEPVNEHRMYLPYAGFIGGVIVVLLWFLQGALEARLTPRHTTALFALVFIGLVIGTSNRITVWQSAEALWADTVEKNPENGRAMNNLALHYMQTREYPKALELLERCEKVWTRYPICAINKGVTLTALGRIDEAEKSLIRGFTLDSSNIWTNFYLGRFYEDNRKDYPKALQYFARADQLSGGTYVDAKIRMGGLHLTLGDRAAAERIARDLLRLDPRNALVQDYLKRVPASGAGSP